MPISQKHCLSYFLIPGPIVIPILTEIIQTGLTLCWGWSWSSWSWSSWSWWWSWWSWWWYVIVIGIFITIVLKIAPKNRIDQLRKYFLCKKHILYCLQLKVKSKLIVAKITTSRFATRLAYQFLLLCHSLTLQQQTLLWYVLLIVALRSWLASFWISLALWAIFIWSWTVAAWIKVVSRVLHLSWGWWSWWFRIVALWVTFSWSWIIVLWVLTSLSYDSTRQQNINI